MEEIIHERMKIAVEIRCLRLQFLEALLAEKEECLIVDICCLLDVKEERHLATRGHVNLVQLFDFEIIQLLC